MSLWFHCRLASLVFELLASMKTIIPFHSLSDMHSRFTCRFCDRHSCFGFHLCPGESDLCHQLTAEWSKKNRYCSDKLHSLLPFQPSSAFSNQPTRLPISVFNWLLYQSFGLLYQNFRTSLSKAAHFSLRFFGLLHQKLRTLQLASSQIGQSHRLSSFSCLLAYSNSRHWLHLVQTPSSISG